MYLFNPSITLSGLPIIDVRCAHHFVTAMNKTRELKTSFLGFQLSVFATFAVALLVLFLLLYSSSTSILDINNDHIALAIPNVYINNNTSASSTVNASSGKPVNHPPVANAGPNQVVNENTTVALVGAGIDSDPNDTLSYLWRQTDGPAVILSNRSSTNPTFIAPIVPSDNELKFSLTVTDDKGATSNLTGVTVTIKHINRPPIADAGTDQAVNAQDIEGAPSSKEQYSFVRAWGSHGSGNGQFYLPSGVTVDSSDSVYVADWGNSRIQKFKADGTFITTWGSEGTENGQFNGPSGIAIDSSGNVYVTDSGNDRIQVFAPST
jgi:hypothetical protein